MMVLLGILLGYLMVGVFFGGFIVYGDRIKNYFGELGLNIETDTAILMGIYIMIEFTLFWPFIITITAKFLRDNDLTIREFVRYLRTGEV